jgi:release factor glutamine methyltransferase
MPSEETSIGEALRWATWLLTAQGFDSPRLDAEILLRHVLGLTRTALYVYLHEPLDAESASRYKEIVRRRLAHEPVAYLTGKRAFYDVDLYVDENVLIPRPESEHLIDAARAWARAQDRSSLRVVDVGTGSGALAIVLARHLPGAKIWAVDISFDALRVAACNVRRYDFQERIDLVCGDLLQALSGPFDLIVANLPYIPREEMPSLPTNVAAYEPHLALDGGEGGLVFMQRLMQQAAQKLAEPGLFLLEIDPRQAGAVTEIAHQIFTGAEVRVLQDYAKRDRIVEIERGE